jgi:predicted RNase H-like HicB family nuclease
MKYLIVIEKAGKNFSVYIPDVPGCVATGKTAEEAKQAIKEVLEFHLQGLAEDGKKAPAPKAQAEYIAV